MTNYELRSPALPAEWEAYHGIRRHVLWELRGRFGVYDEHHPDETAVGNHPLLLFFREEPVGVVRIDLRDSVAQIRRMAVRADLQRQGHGTALLHLAQSYALQLGATELIANVDPGAVGFYERLGFRHSDEFPDTGSDSVPMRMALSSD